MPIVKPHVTMIDEYYSTERECLRRLERAEQEASELTLDEQTVSRLPMRKHPVVTRTAWELLQRGFTLVDCATVMNLSVPTVRAALYFYLGRALEHPMCPHAPKPGRPVSTTRLVADQVRFRRGAFQPPNFPKDLSVYKLVPGRFGYVPLTNRSGWTTPEELGPWMRDNSIDIGELTEMESMMAFYQENNKGQFLPLEDALPMYNKTITADDPAYEG